MTETAVRPAWGLGRVVSENAVAAWGARLIVTQHGDVDMLPDRLGSDGGPHSRTLLDVMGQQIPARDLLTLIGELLACRWMDTREGEDFILYQDASLVVHANTNGSAGYCYVTAWLTPPTASSTLLASATDAYDKEDRAWFYGQTTDNLTTLWAIACDINQGAAWDDEVYDALAERGHFKEN